MMAASRYNFVIMISLDFLHHTGATKSKRSEAKEKQIWGNVSTQGIQKAEIPGTKLPRLIAVRRC
jgi:hypothetical protein